MSLRFFGGMSTEDPSLIEQRLAEIIEKDGGVKKEGYDFNIGDVTSISSHESN